MHKIEYKVSYDFLGYPEIYIPDEYIDLPEHKLFYFEMVRYHLHKLSTNTENLDEKNKTKIFDLLKFINSICIELQILLKKDTENYNILDISKFDIIVENIKKRDELNYEGFIYNNKLYKRKIGLRVYVLDEKKIYTLVNGIDNKNWEEMQFIQNN